MAADLPPPEVSFSHEQLQQLGRWVTWDFQHGDPPAEARKTATKYRNYFMAAYPAVQFYYKKEHLGGSFGAAFAKLLVAQKQEAPTSSKPLMWAGPVMALNSHLRDPPKEEPPREPPDLGSAAAAAASPASSSKKAEAGPSAPPTVASKATKRYLWQAAEEAFETRFKDVADLMPTVKNSLPHFPDRGPFQEDFENERAKLRRAWSSEARLQTCEPQKVQQEASGAALFSETSAEKPTVDSVDAAETPVAPLASTQQETQPWWVELWGPYHDDHPSVAAASGPSSAVSRVDAAESPVAPPVSTQQVSQVDASETPAAAPASTQKKASWADLSDDDFDPRPKASSSSTTVSRIDVAKTRTAPASGTQQASARTAVRHAKTHLFEEKAQTHAKVRAARRSRCDDPGRQAKELASDGVTVRKHSSNGCAWVSFTDPLVKSAILDQGNEVSIKGIAVKIKPHIDKETNTEAQNVLYAAWGHQVEKTTPLSESELLHFFQNYAEAALR